MGVSPTTRHVSMWVRVTDQTVYPDQKGTRGTAWVLCAVCTGAQYHEARYMSEKSPTRARGEYTMMQYDTKRTLPAKVRSYGDGTVVYDHLLTNNEATGGLCYVLEALQWTPIYGTAEDLSVVLIDTGKDVGVDDRVLHMNTAQSVYRKDGALGMFLGGVVLLPPG